MLSKTAVRSRQLLFLMLIARVSFSYTFIASLSAGNCVQDILPAIPVVAVIDLLLFIPILRLLKRHPGHDLIDCIGFSLGKGFGAAAAAFYFLYFAGAGAVLLILFQQFYFSTMDVQASSVALALPLVIVAAYGAIKGIESIARFSVFSLLFYVIVVIFVNVAMAPYFNPGYLKPLFYSGPRVFLLAVVAGVASSFQILILAMCAPFLKPTSSLAKITLLWALLSFTAAGIMQFNIITVLGPFGGKQLFPFKTLAIFSAIPPFERLDAFLMIAWVVDSVLGLTLYVFLASQCLMHTKLRRWRRSMIAATAAVIYAASQIFLPDYIKNLNQFFGVPLAAAFSAAVVVLPLIALIADLVKERVSGNHASGEKVV